MSDFKNVVMFCADNKEFVEQFNRLSKSTFLKPVSGFDLMIDKACGVDGRFKDVDKFISFVFEFIWLPLIQDKGRQG